ncbi:MAG: hypothetical protein Q7R73_01040 [bacterium]|nr:hypothetical protein [bacterium]
MLWNQEACDLAIENGKFLLRHEPEAKIICLRGGDAPPGPIAEQLRQEEFGVSERPERTEI